MRTAAIVLMLLVLTGCQRPPMVLAEMFVAGVIDPLADVPPQEQTNEQTLFFATDRLYVADQPLAERYTRLRSDRLDLGKMTLAFGPEGAWQQIVAATRAQSGGKLYSPAIVSIDRLGQLPLPGDTSDKLPSDNFLRELEADLQRSPGKTITIYTHGFNSSFAEAAYTTAEYGLHTGGLGPFILYSWPSYNNLFEYSHDRDSVHYTATHFRRLIELLAEEINAGRLSARKIQIIAHSSGAEVAGAALRELSLLSRGQTPQQRRDRWHIGSVLMVAPDISTDVARERLLKEDIAGIFEQIVVYSSYHDQALSWAASILYRTPRIGSIRENQLTDADKRWLMTAPNVALVDIDSNPYAGIVKHGHHRFSPAVVADIILCLRTDLTFQQRGLVREEDAVIWQFAPDYPRRVTEAAKRVYDQPAP